MRSSTPEGTLILTGCLVALVTGLLTSCALVAIALAPAFSGAVPIPGEQDPGQHDLTMVVKEGYLNEELTSSLPTSVPGTVTLDVQPENRLVATAIFDLALTKVRVVTTLRLSAANGRLQVTVLSVDVAGHELMSLANLIGVNGSTLGQSMSGTIQGRIAAGLGEGAQIMDVSTGDTDLTITAKLE